MKLFSYQTDLWRHTLHFIDFIIKTKETKQQYNKKNKGRDIYILKINLSCSEFQSISCTKDCKGDFKNFAVCIKDQIF